jgi:pimeloyl-ACP methyl ester carboxylesterase
VVALAIVAAAAGAGLAYQAIGASRDHRRFPMNGALVSVGRHKLHLYCTGRGSPAVILEGPQTGLGAMWGPVQNGIAGFTRVCSYDRAGFGWSEPGPLPRTSEAILTELHEALARAGEKPPYVVVGASAGGLHARLFAARFANEVAGVVLADSSHPDQALRLHVPEDPAGHFRMWGPFLPAMHRLGILRIGLHQEARPGAISADAWREILYLREKTNSYRAVLDESAAWKQSADQVRASGNLGAMPLIVLSGSRGADADWRAGWIDGLQAELARLSSNGKQVVLGNSGHGIQFDAPGAIIDAVRELCPK